MSSRNQPGFTLFELVIAVAIFMVMGAIAYPGLTNMARTGNIIGETNQQLSELQFAVTYLNRDWIQVSPRKILNRYGDEESNVVIEDNRITFTRGGRSNLTGQQRSQLQRVRYRLVDKTLVREHWLSLDQGIEEEPFASVLLRDVESFEIYLIDSSERKIETWPTISSVGVGEPIALSFTLELAKMGAISRILEIPGGTL
jgi:general secretion pathway protein J